MDLEQTIENTFFGKIKNSLRRIKHSLTSRIALYSLALLGGAGIACGCEGDGQTPENDDAFYTDVYDADINTDDAYSDEDYADIDTSVPDVSTVYDIKQTDRFIPDIILDFVGDATDAVQADGKDIQDIQDTYMEDTVEPVFSCVLDDVTMTYVMNQGAVYVSPSDFVVIDGDTIKNIVTGITYRFSAVDAAELYPPQCGIGEFSDINYGQLGKEYVEYLFKNAQSLLLITSGKKDEYGRTLGYFIVDKGNGNEHVQCLEIVNHLAYQTVTFWSLGSFPPLAEIVLAAANAVGDPPFMKPWDFKENGQPCADENDM